MISIQRLLCDFLINSRYDALLDIFRLDYLICPQYDSMRLSTQPKLSEK